MYQAYKFGFRSPRNFKTGTSTPSSSSRSFKRKGSILKFANQSKNQQYQTLSNNFPKNSVYYDSSIPMKDQSLHHSIPTNQSQDSWNQYSLKKSIKQNQYSLTKFNTERKKYDHQINLLKKQILKLQKELQSKEKQIHSIEQNKVQFKQIQLELVQTYRVINYYEGKYKQQQKIIHYLETLLNSQVQSQTKGKIKEGLEFKKIIQFFRNQSIELKGQLQKSYHENTKVTLQLQKLQKKYNELQKNYKQSLKKTKSYKNDYQIAHLSLVPQNKKVASIYQNRLQNSQRKIALRRADDQISVSSSVRSNSSLKKFQTLNSLGQSNNFEKNEMAKVYGNFSSKINKIQKQLDYFKIQNEKAQNQLIEKIKIIGQLTLQNDELKYLLEKRNNSNDKTNQAKINENQQQSQNILGNIVASFPQSYLTLKKLSTTESQQNSQSKMGNNVNKDNERNYLPENDQKRKNTFKNLTVIQLSKKIHQSHQKSYKFKYILPETVRKLRYHLIRQDITYSKLLQMIAQKISFSQNSNLFKQQFEDIPYQLTHDQVDSFISEYKRIQAYLKEKELLSMQKNANQPNKDLTIEEKQKQFKQNLKQIFRQNIPQFKNITLRKDASLTSQITKIFKNRLAQLDPYLRDRKKSILTFQQAQKLFRQEWHLSDQQIDFIMLKCCQQSHQYSIFDFYKTIHFFIQN